MQFSDLNLIYRLKQDDFRKLLQTPRPGDVPSRGILGMATPRQRMPPQTP